MAYVSQNPATEEVIAEYPVLNKDAAFELAAAVHDAWPAWRRAPLADRAQCLKRAAALLRERKGDFARLMAAEMGKQLHEGEGEVEKCAWVCEYYADRGPEFLQPEPTPTEGSVSYAAFEPLGTVLAIMPWNFPFWQVFRFCAPALMAGNSFILKHAPNSTGCALAIEKLLADAGLPHNVCRVLIAENDTVEAVIGHPGVQAVTLTGSTRAGRAVAAAAGRHLKKTVLELGGSDPYIILEDADIAAAARACVASRLINSGQSCIAAKRFIAVKAIAKAFEEAVVLEMRTKTFGAPLKDRYDIGPMARQDLRDELHKQVTDSVNAGARLSMGGEIPPGPGFFYPPTLLLEPPPDAPAAREELFGPAATIFVVENEEEAIRLANDSDYGLGAAIFTGDKARGERIAREELQAGACFVNDFVKSDPRLPFGGVKLSGYGRELAVFGIREFVNIKTVFVK